MSSAGERLTLRGPVGAIEAVLEEPAYDQVGEASAVAICCHPHPVHGGTMANTIVVRTARALRSAGVVTLRFNFRGVEGSEGVHHGGGGEGSEEDDAAVCLDYLNERFPGLPSWAAGYSFGARTVCELAVRPDTSHAIERLVLVALPVAHYGPGSIERVGQPALLLFGENDDFGTGRDLPPNLGSHLLVEEIPGADHFFRGRTPLVEEHVAAYAQANRKAT